MEGEHSDQSNALGDDDLRQAEAVLERAFPDHDKPFGQYDACERAALPKCPAGNRARALPNDKFARNFVRIHFEQMVAQIERAVLPVALVVPVRRIFKCQAVERGHTVRQPDLCELKTVRKRISADRRDALRNGDGRQFFAIREGIQFDGRKPISE